MSTASSQRAWQAAQRRAEREASRRLKELEKMERENEKRSALDAARVEVECYETKLAVLQSTHRECMERVDWVGMAGQLPVPKPSRKWAAELAVYASACAGTMRGEDVERALAQAREVDAAALVAAISGWEREEREREKFALLARDVLRGDAVAYGRALIELRAFAELEAAGATLDVKVTDRLSIECGIQVRGIEVIPEETKTLSATGKLSVKSTPRPRMHELFQDYLCSAVLRVGREVFGCLPVRTVTVHASTRVFDPGVGRDEWRTVASVRFERERFEALNFDRLDPSDAVDGFESRCDFKASRKSGAFIPVDPLPSRPSLRSQGDANVHVPDLLERVRRLRATLIAERFSG